jgi:hypothetical protein
VDEGPQPRLKVAAPWGSDRSAKSLLSLAFNPFNNTCDLIVATVVAGDERSRKNRPCTADAAAVKAIARGSQVNTMRRISSRMPRSGGRQKAQQRTEPAWLSPSGSKWLDLLSQIAPRLKPAAS